MIIKRRLIRDCFSLLRKSLSTKLTSFLAVSLVVRKPVFEVSDLIRHKPVCTTTEDSYRLETSDLETLEACAADLRVCFRICLIMRLILLFKKAHL